MQYIRSAGFEGVFDAANLQLDHGLATALVERWRPETNTFHFPIGEATVTLEDVQVLWGLPVDGPVVSGTWVTDTSNIDRWNSLCQRGLGFIPDDEGELRNGKLRIVSILQQILRPFDEDDDEACQQRARLFIMGFFATMLFVDSNNSDIPLNYLENLWDLSREGRKSWGGAVVAYLYRCLSKAFATGRKGLDGPVLLLQLWAWERMPNIAPNVIYDKDDPYNYETVLANKYVLPLYDTYIHIYIYIYFIYY